MNSLTLRLLKAATDFSEKSTIDGNLQSIIENAFIEGAKYELRNKPLDRKYLLDVAKDFGYERTVITKEDLIEVYREIIDRYFDS